MPFGEQILRGIYVLKEKYWEHIPLGERHKPSWNTVQTLLSFKLHCLLSHSECMQHFKIKPKERAIGIRPTMFKKPILLVSRLHY